MNAVKREHHKAENSQIVFSEFSGWLAAEWGVAGDDVKAHCSAVAEAGRATTEAHAVTLLDAPVIYAPANQSLLFDQLFRSFLRALQEMRGLADADSLSNHEVQSAVLVLAEIEKRLRSCLLSRAETVDGFPVGQGAAPDAIAEVEGGQEVDAASTAIEERTSHSRTG